MLIYRPILQSYKSHIFIEQSGWGKSRCNPESSGHSCKIHVGPTTVVPATCPDDHILVDVHAGVIQIPTSHISPGMTAIVGLMFTEIFNHRWEVRNFDHTPSVEPATANISAVRIRRIQNILVSLCLLVNYWVAKSRNTNKATERRLGEIFRRQWRVFFRHKSGEIRQRCNYRVCLAAFITGFNQQHTQRVFIQQMY